MRGRDTLTFLGKTVGGDNPCFIIGEIGLNHNGDLGQAKNLIEIASAAGFDAVKLQSFIPELRSFPAGKTAKYVERVLQQEETDYELFRKLALSEEDFVQLKAFADSIGIALFSAPFDVQSLNQLTAIGSGKPAIPFDNQISHRP